VTSQEFLSFTPAMKVAEGFAAERSADETKGIVLEVERASKAKPVSLMSFYEDEQESLFSPNQGLKVVSDPLPRPGFDGVKTIECEEM
jgi:hypothetical protein